MWINSSRLCRTSILQVTSNRQNQLSTGPSASRLETSIGPNVKWTSLVLYNVLQPAHSNRLNYHNKPIAYHSAADPHPYVVKVGPVSSTYPPLA